MIVNDRECEDIYYVACHYPRKKQKHPKRMCRLALPCSLYAFTLLSDQAAWRSLFRNALGGTEILVN